MAIGQRCANCGAVLSGPFCSTCGQEDRPLDPTMREFGRDLADTVLSLNGRTLASFRRLLLSPGFLTVEQFSGRRAAWLTPIQMYLVASVVYFAASALAGQRSVNITFSGESDEVQTELQGRGFADQEALNAQIARREETWRPRVMFVLVPLLGALVGLARRRSGRRYPQHLIFALHVHAAWFAAFTVSVLGGALPVGEWVGTVLTFAVVAYVVGYLALALRLVYGGTTRRAVTQAALVSFAYWVSAIALILSIVLPLVFL